MGPYPNPVCFVRSDWFIYLEKRPTEDPTIYIVGRLGEPGGCCYKSVEYGKPYEILVDRLWGKNDYQTTFLMRGGQMTMVEGVYSKRSKTYRGGIETTKMAPMHQAELSVVCLRLTMAARVVARAGVLKPTNIYYDPEQNSHLSQGRCKRARMELNEAGSE